MGEETIEDTTGTEGAASGAGTAAPSARKAARPRKRRVNGDGRASDGTDRPAVEEAAEAAKAEAHRRTAEAQHQLAQMRHDPEALRKLFREGVYPYKEKMRTQSYESHKAELQVELLKVQNWVKETGQRVVALHKPSERERSQWYFQRYIEHLPTAGEMVLFDRSWYNRAGVERVMGFCNGTEYLEFMRQCPELERMLVNSGVRLFKYWFSVTRDEQGRRFKERHTDPLKQWKLSPIDIASPERWDDYTEAKEAMFFYTDTADAPWTVVKSDDKKRARLACMQHFLSSLPYPRRNSAVVRGPDPLIVGPAERVVGRDRHILGLTLHPGAAEADAATQADGASPAT
jgi:polyphosphate kinase 2